MSNFFRPSLLGIGAVTVLGLLAASSAQASAKVATHPVHSTVKRHGVAPLRFDAPAAGPSRARADYESCVDHPSPDGLSSDCPALLTAAAPKPRK